jgi:hypothetical protein
MFDRQLELLAEQVRKNAKAERLPIDLSSIAAFDDVILQPLEQHEGFNGKIEFLAEENVFVIYHPSEATYRYPSRLRFSIAHELGHFHIDSHRANLVRGITHNSKSGFRSKDPKEIQADEFAAALLIPANTMTPTIEKRGFMTLEQVRMVSTNCATSLFATGIRYLKLTGEAAVVVLAHNGKVRSSFSSDEAKAHGFGKVSCETLPPHLTREQLIPARGSHPRSGAQHGELV